MCPREGELGIFPREARLLVTTNSCITWTSYTVFESDAAAGRGRSAFVALSIDLVASAPDSLLTCLLKILQASETRNRTASSEDPKVINPALLARGGKTFLHPFLLEDKSEAITQNMSENVPERQGSLEPFRHTERKTSSYFFFLVCLLSLYALSPPRSPRNPNKRKSIIITDRGHPAVFRRRAGAGFDGLRIPAHL